MSKKFPVEPFEALASRSAVPSPGAASPSGRPRRPRRRRARGPGTRGCGWRRSRSRRGGVYISGKTVFHCEVCILVVGIGGVKTKQSTAAGALMLEGLPIHVLTDTLYVVPY